MFIHLLSSLQFPFDNLLQLDFAIITFDIQQEIDALDAIILSKKTATLQSKSSLNYEAKNNSHYLKNNTIPGQSPDNNRMAECEVIEKVKNFKYKVDMVSKLLKAESSIDEPEIIHLLTSIAELAKELIPTYSNAKLASDVFASTKKLLKETVTFKNLWKNHERYGDQLWKVTEALGVLYINVAAANI